MTPKDTASVKVSLKLIALAAINRCTMYTLIYQEADGNTSVVSNGNDVEALGMVLEAEEVFRRHAEQSEGLHSGLGSEGQDTSGGATEARGTHGDQEEGKEAGDQEGVTERAP